MSEKTNFVIVFQRSSLERAGPDWAELTVELGSHVLGTPPQTWVAIRNLEMRRGNWPLSAQQIVESVARGEVVAAYPRDDGSSVDGSIIWSLGGRIGTATVSIPRRRLSEHDQRRLAITSVQLAGKFGAILCAVGSELELNDGDPVIPDVVAKRPGVELVTFPSEKGVEVCMGVAMSPL